MAFLVPALLVAFGIILIPLAQALWISFRRYTLTVPGRPFIWLANYGTALSDAVFWKAIGRTLYFTLTSTGLKLVLGMLIADEFFYALILTSSLKAKTIPVAIAEFSGQHMVDYGMIAAGGVLAALPPVLIALVLQRHIVRELAAGAVKGSFGQRGFTAPIPVWYGTLIIDYREGCHLKKRLAVTLGIVVIAALLAAGCASKNATPTSTPAAAPASTPTRNAAGYYEWTVQDLKQALGKKDFVLVNVHIPFEGRIAGTDLEIPFDQITRPENLAKLPADKNARMVLYCRSGSMSKIAVNALVKLGYTNLVDVKGGMLAWEAAS